MTARLISFLFVITFVCAFPPLTMGQDDIVAPGSQQVGTWYNV